jgi:hypothetical protein
MRAVVAILAALLCQRALPAIAQPKCGSFPAPVPAPALDLAPPADFVEICSKDAVLCAKLASGYPPTAKMVGYFVIPEEWQRYREGQLSGFTRYLIAQISEGTKPADFSGLRSFIRSRQGEIPDNTELSPAFDSAGRSKIGVFEDSDDAIASGVIMKLRHPGSGPSSTVILASANMAFLAKDRVLSLYAFTDVTAQPSAEPVKQLTREWLRCLRRTKR